MIWEQGNLRMYPRLATPPMKLSKDSLLACEIRYAMFKQVIRMPMGIFGQAVLGLYERAGYTDSACCRTTVGGKLNKVFATIWKLNMYAISLLKHGVAVLSKS
jgi:hypothetical protein